MIDALLNKTCTIKRRLDNTRNSNNKYEYQPIENVPCIAVKKFGKVAKMLSENYVDIAMVILVTVEILETDLIVLDDGYQYRIARGMSSIGIEEIQDFFSGAIEGYQISLTREREADEQQTPIMESSNREGLAT